MPMLTPQPLMQNNHLLHKSRQFGGKHGLRTGNDSFFLNIPNLYSSRLSRSAKRVVRYFRVFLVVCSKFTNVYPLSGSVHRPLIRITQLFFFQKSRIFIYLQDFLFWFGIWIQALENMESSHYVSVVHGGRMNYRSKIPQTKCIYRSLFHNGAKIYVEINSNLLRLFCQKRRGLIEKVQDVRICM